MTNNNEITKTPSSSTSGSGSNLPAPTNMCCIRTPMVLDQTLIKRCLKCCDDKGKLNPDLCKKIPGVTSKKDVVSIGKIKDFNVIVNSVSLYDVNSGNKYNQYKKVIINFEINFSVDVTIKTANNKTSIQTLDYSINQTVIIPEFYCSNPMSYFYVSEFNASIGEKKGGPGKDDFIKVQVIVEDLARKLVSINCDECCSDNPSKPGCVYLCLTLGLFISIRSEVTVQLLVPCYGYCKKPQVVSDDIKPCEQFDNTPFPNLYPPL